MSQFLFRNLIPQFIDWRKDIKYKTQVGLCVAEGFRKRGYSRPEKSEQTWDIYWVEKQNLDHFYANHRVNRDQRLNHYRTFYEICRKDNLNRNLKKHKRNLQREGKTKQAAQYNFAPLTFHLPIQFSVFSEEFKRLSVSNQSNIWIMKPTAKSQGKGIFLFNKLAAAEEWLENSEGQAYICQKYIENPLLIGHKKFDLRLYVLCTSYRPLNAYLYREGFARFTHSRYDDSNISATQIHLTNVAIQKHTSQYSRTLGGKWMLSNLKKYLLSKKSSEQINFCFSQIKNLIIKTLRSVSKIMSNQQNCFELYGFDIMLDSNLKPWLIEVNGSPSMRANTKKDKQLKIGVIDDMLSVIDLENIMIGNQETFGGFDLICKNDVNFQFQYFMGTKACMLGCKMEREKCYRGLANSLNNHYRLNQHSSRINNTQSQNTRQQDSDVSSPSPYRKGFSVRRQKQGNSLTNSKQIPKKQPIVTPVNTLPKQTPIVFQSQQSSMGSVITRGEGDDRKINPQYNLIKNQQKMVKSSNVEFIDKKVGHQTRRNSNLMRRKEDGEEREGGGQDELMYRTRIVSNRI